MRAQKRAFLEIFYAVGGAFIPQVLVPYKERRSERRALLILHRNAKIKKISLPDYLGQMKLNMESIGGGHDEAA